MGINNLIARFLADKATKEEWEQLDTWKKESEENLRELRELQSIWENSLDLRDYETFDKQTAWNAVNRNLDDTSQNISGGKSKLSFAWISGIAAAVAVIIFAFIFFGDNTPYGYEDLVTNNSVQVFTLPDGSEITLNKKTELSYASDFTVNRTIILEGEAYFDVERDEEHPFTIQTDFATVTVLGTSFNIEEMPSHVEVFVTSGSVAVSHDNEEVILQKNERVRVSSLGIEKLKTPGKNYLSWRTNKLSFEDTPLHQAVADIEAHFGKRVVFSSSSKAMNIKVSDVFVDQDFESVMEQLALITGITYQVEGNSLIIQ